jgi:hypothetical protein
MNLETRRRKGHEINWDDATCLVNEKGLKTRKTLKSFHITMNRDKCMNITEDLRISTYNDNGRVDFWRGIGERK